MKDDISREDAHVRALERKVARLERERLRRKEADLRLRTRTDRKSVV